MSFENPNLGEMSEGNKEKKGYEERVKYIRDELNRLVDSNNNEDLVVIKELIEEFTSLWKNLPEEVSDQTHNYIDEITRGPLLEKLNKKIEDMNQ